MAPLALFAAGSVVTAADGQPPPPPTAADVDLHELYYGGQLPQDRTGSQTLAAAAELIDQRRYGEAAALIMRVLGRDKDAVRLTAEGRPESLKRAGAAMINALPPAGRRAYRLETETPAVRSLNALLARGARPGPVFRKRPGTRAAAVALWFVAVESYDRGEAGLCREALARLSAGDHADDFEPQLTLLAAAACIGQADMEAAASLVESLAESVWAADNIEGLGRLDDPDVVLERLSRVACKQGAVESRHRRDSWRRPGGGRSGNPVVAGGLPHLWASWSALNEVDPARLETVASVARRLEASGRPMIPAAGPLVVGGVVAFQTGTGLAAVDIASGRRLWQTDRDDGREKNSAAASFAIRYRAVQDSDIAQTLTSRVALRTFFDHVGGGISSDGRRIYEVVHVDRSARAPRWSPFGTGYRYGREPYGAGGSRLIAYDLAAEGKMVWRLSGRDRPAGTGVSSGPAFFLCSPLAIGASLFTVVEQDQQLSLWQVDADSGKIVWRQPLLTVVRGADQSLRRRLVGASLAASGATLVCSTGLGVVAAVDVLDRTLLWVDRFPVDEKKQSPESGGWRRRRERWPIDANAAWLDNRVVIDGDRVFVASPESPHLHCLSLGNGEPVWRCERGDSSTLVAAIDQRPLLAAAAALRVLTTDGQRAWEHRWEDAVLAGRGVVRSGLLLAPLSDGTVLAINAATGRPHSRLRSWTGAVLGNLAAAGDVLISQRPESIDRFEGRESLIASAELAVSGAAPVSAKSLRILGEHELDQGRVDSAVERFESALDASPAAPLVRRRLLGALALRLDDEGPNRADLRRLESLAVTDAERAAAALRSAEFAAGHDRLLEATNAALRAVSFLPGEAAPMRCGVGWHATPMARLAGLLSRGLEEATAPLRGAVQERLLAASGRPMVQSQRLNLSRLMLALPPLGGPPGGDDRAMMSASSGPSPDHAAAPASLARRFVTVRSAARSAMQQLGGIQAAFHAEPLITRSPGGRFQNPHSSDLLWSTRQVSSRPRAGVTDGSSSRRQGVRGVPLISAGRRPGDPLTDLAIDLDSGELLGFNALGDLVFATGLGSAGRSYVRQVRAGSRTAVWRFGPCLYLAAGDHVLALELVTGRPTSDRRLWSTEGLVDRLARGRMDTPGRSGGRALVGAIDPTASAQILAVSPLAVLVLKGGMLMAIDPATGGLRWARHDVAFTSQTAADARAAYCITADGAPVRLSLVDGSDLGPWQPPEGRWIACRQGMLTTHLRSGNAVEVRTTRLATDQIVQRHQTGPAARVAGVDDWGHAILGADGSFVLLDLATGVKLLDRDLDICGRPQSLRVAPRGRGVVVLVACSEPRVRAGTRLQPVDPGTLLTGRAFFLDPAQDEPSWPRPAHLENVGWLARQPRAAPLLCFATQVQVQHRGRATGNATRLLVLDQQTGRAVYDQTSEDFPLGGGYRVGYQRGPSPRLTITSGSRSLTLRTTAKPAPPAPPADRRASRVSPSSALGDLLGGVQRAWQSLRPAPGEGSDPAE